jgi:hypothetical protein
MIKGGINVSAHLLNSVSEPILDFNGREYRQTGEKLHREVIEINKMVLLSISQDNKNFLFMDRLLKKWEVYKLEEMIDQTFEF